MINISENSALKISLTMLLAIVGSVASCMLGAGIWIAMNQNVASANTEDIKDLKSGFKEMLEKDLAHNSIVDDRLARIETKQEILINLIKIMNHKKGE